MRVLTENEVRELAQRLERGGTFTLPSGTLLTPLARDYLREKDIRVIEQTRQRGGSPAVSDSDDDEALVTAVAEEVTRAMAGGDAPAQAAAALAHGGKDAVKAENRAVVWGMGADRPGILAAVTALLSERKVNIIEISQTLLSGVFAMVVIVDVSKCTCSFQDLKGVIETLGKENGMSLSAQRDEIFQYMHRI